MRKIKVSQRVSSIGTQVFAFKLANGRTVEVEFAPHIMDLEHHVYGAGISLLDKNGESMPLGVGGLDNEKIKTKCAYLWFTTDEEDEQYRRMVQEECEMIRDSLAPLFRGRSAPGSVTGDE